MERLAFLARCTAVFALCIQGGCSSTPAKCAGTQCAAAATCSDGILNGDESAVDCGGSCPSKCADGQTCNQASDCSGGVCTGGLCASASATASCTDGLRNGSETDVDCGGGTCPACADGKACGLASDCASGVCTGSACAAPTCTDGVKNGAETDVDCGGSCPACADGATCLVDGDCASALCDAAAHQCSMNLTLLAGHLGGPGNLDGVGGGARFFTPVQVAYDGAGHLFVADFSNYAIREVTIATGEVATLAGTAAILAGPQGVAFNSAGDLFVADYYNNIIYKIVLASGAITPFAGDGTAGSLDDTGTAAEFNGPAGLACDGTNLFVADQNNGTIRQIVTSGANAGQVTTLAGTAGNQGYADDLGPAAQFNLPNGLAWALADDSVTGNLFVADYNNMRIRMVVTSGANPGQVTTLAGDGTPSTFDGTGTAAEFAGPDFLATDGAGNLFVSEDGCVIRHIDLVTAVVTTIAGDGTPQTLDGTGAAAEFFYPQGVALDGAGNLLVAEWSGSVIRKMVIAGAGAGAVTTLAGAPPVTGSDDAVGADARFNEPKGLVMDDAGNLFVADTLNHEIRQVVMATGQVTTLAGSAATAGSNDGTGAGASFRQPTGIAYDGAGNLFVTDRKNNTIRQVVIASGAVTTLAGTPQVTGSSDGTGPAAQFVDPMAIAYDGAGNLFVTDLQDHTIRKVVVSTGVVTTFAGATGQAGSDDGIWTAARFGSPAGIAADGHGNLFVGDQQYSTIRKIVLATGEVSTFAGTSGEMGGDDGIGAAARFSAMRFMTSDGTNLFVADMTGSIVRKIVIATAEVTTLAGSYDRAGVVLGAAPAGLNWPFGVALVPGGGLVISTMYENSLLLLR